MDNKTQTAVIVALYNAEPYLTECIQSIVNQTYKELEIILVDDGSTDRSFSICRTFAQYDSRIKVIHQDNKGTLNAKRAGLEAAESEYIMFVDADDWIMPRMCEVLHGIMTREHTDLVASGIIRYFSENQCVWNYDTVGEGKYSGEEYKEKVLTHMLCDGVFPRRGVDASLAIKIFRKDLLYPVLKEAEEQYGYLFGEDTAVLYPYMLKADSVYILREGFYYHRQYENSREKYYGDQNFEYKVRGLYSYLKGVFEKHPLHTVLMRQLDYFVCGLFMEKYNLQAGKIVQKMPVLQQYLFPFHRVRQGSRVLLYGAGAVGQSYYVQLTKTGYCEEIFWQDRNAQKYRREGLPVCPVDVDLQVGACVIAVQDEGLAEEIKAQLAGDGMDTGKIVWEPPLLSMW